MSRAIRDKVSLFSRPHLLRAPAFKIINTLQDEDAGVQVLALATTLEAVCMGVGLDSHELITKVRRAMQEIDGPYTKEVGAIKDYAKGELNVRA